MAMESPKAYPVAAFVVTLIGGILILLDGLYLLAVSAFVSTVSSAYGVSIPGVSGLFEALAAVGLIFGLIILIGAIMMWRNPSSAKMWGIVVILLGLISIISGGGFILGLILALVGGILALVWHPPAAAQTAWSSAPTAPPAAPAGGAPPAMGGARYCASCGSPNAANVQFCAKCGAPMPPG
jgi:hypothetical protein